MSQMSAQTHLHKLASNYYLRSKIPLGQLADLGKAGVDYWCMARINSSGATLWV
jgi:hypothetical protein